MSLYTFLLLLQLPRPFHPAMLQGSESCCTTISNAPGYSRGRKRDIFYSRTLTWKGTFIFADRLSLGPLLSACTRRYFFPLQNSRGDINAHIYSWAGFTTGFRGDLQYGYRSRTFKEFSFRHRRPSNFSYSFSNRLVRASWILESPCQCALCNPLASRDSYVPVNLLFPFLHTRSSASRDPCVNFQFPNRLLFLQ